MLDVIVDSELIPLREEARKGNFSAILDLACYIQKGVGTQKDLDRALLLFNYLHGRKEELGLPEILWQLLCQKMHIYAAREEVEQGDLLALEMVQDMVQYPPERWDFDKLIGSIEWLQDSVLRQENCE